MRKCNEVYQKSSLMGDWRKQGQEDIEHDFSILLFDESNTRYKICSHCNAKHYPTNL